MEDKGTAGVIEHIKELCESANKNINKHHKNLLDSKKLILVHGDERKEYNVMNIPHMTVFM